MTIFRVARGGDVEVGARLCDTSAIVESAGWWRRGGQGRAVRPARRGSLEGPGRELSPATIRFGTPLAAFLLAPWGWAQQ